MKKNNNIRIYNSSNIKILKGLDAVKKRPGMYIGDISDGSGLHHMVFELIDNSIDEATSGYCNTIKVIIYNDNSISVKDNGRGIPVDMHNEGISTAEVVMTMLHSGGKFDNYSYEMSGGLHGVGVSVVNALSKKLILIIKKEKYIYKQIYYNGIPKYPIKVIGETLNTGTYIRFWPNLNIFVNKFKFQKSIIFKRLKELSFLNKNIKIILLNKINNEKNTFCSSKGLIGFINYLNKEKNIINDKIFNFSHRKNNIIIDVCIQWNNDDYKENIYCYTNNIYQKDGGSHLIGLKSAIVKSINVYINKFNINKNNKLNIINDDIKDGLTAVISIKMKNPKFSSQTKDKLISSEIKNVVELCVYENFIEYLYENPLNSKNILKKIISIAKNRELLKKNKELNKKKNLLNTHSLCGKLSDCQEQNPLFSELYIVEGDSAGGSAKQGRNRKNQAILPLKGKILNIEKNNLIKILSSKEIINLITALGCGIGKDNFNINKLRYNKIIIMTDADIDGAHIRTLLLTFFYRYMKEIIECGYVYIAQPPLYRIKINKKYLYIKDNNNMNKYLVHSITKGVYFYNKNNTLIQKKKIISSLLKYFKLEKIFLNLNKKYSHLLINKLIYFPLYKSYFKNYKKIKFWCNKIILNINKNLSFYDRCEFKLIKYKNKFYKIKFILHLYNIIHEYIFNINFVNSLKYKKIFNFSLYLKKYINNIFYIKKNNLIKYINNFDDILNWLNNEFKNEISIQRYKGLGEMNPNQLWETTMNPLTRNISKVSINDITSTDKLFSILMGDEIIPRKKFLKKNM